MRQPLPSIHISYPRAGQTSGSHPLLARLTHRSLSRINSLMLNSTASSRAISSSWAGPVLPRTAPKEMSTAPAQKSALIKLQSRTVGEVEGTWFQSGSRPHPAEGHSVGYAGQG